MSENNDHQGIEVAKSVVFASAKGLEITEDEINAISFYFKNWKETIPINGFWWSQWNIPDLYKVHAVIDTAFEGRESTKKNFIMDDRFNSDVWYEKNGIFCQFHEELYIEELNEKQRWALQEGDLDYNQAPISEYIHSLDCGIPFEEVYSVSELKIWEQFKGMRVQVNTSTEEGDHLLLIGSTKVKGKLIRNEGPIEGIYFIPQDAVILKVDSNEESYFYYLYEANVIENGILDEQTKQALMWGNELECEVEIINFDHTGWVASEYISEIELWSYTILE